MDGTVHNRVFDEASRYGLQTKPLSPTNASTNRHRRGDNMLTGALPVPAEEMIAAERCLFGVLTAAYRIEIGVGLDQQDLDDLDIPASDYINSLDPPPMTGALVEAWTRNMMGRELT